MSIAEHLYCFIRLTNMFTVSIERSSCEQFLSLTNIVVSAGEHVYVLNS